MKKHLVRRFLFVSLAALALLTFPSAAHAQHRRNTNYGGGEGRLVIWRIPGLGNDLIVGVKIDGRHVTDLTYGKHLDMPLSAGSHTVAVQPYPRVYSDSGDAVTINVRPGELYNFTAKGSVRQLLLRRS
jgi:hypothetical protein